MNLRLDTYRSKAFYIALGVIAAIYGIFSYLTPFQYDDLAFLGGYMSYTGGSTSFDMGAYVDMCREIRNFDNGRLANILDLLVVLCMPKWLFAVITGVVTAGMFYFLTLFVTRQHASIRHVSRFGTLAVIWAVSMVAFPWRNNILVPDYTLNYLYATFFNLWFIDALSSSVHANRSQWAYIPYCLLALIAGAFHEGFSAPIAAGLAVYAATKRFRMPASWWMLCIVYAIGAVLAMSSPGIWLRAGRELGYTPSATWIQTLLFITPLASLALILLILAVAIPSLRHRMHIPYRSMTYCICAVAMVVSTAMCFILPAKPRNGWLPEVMAIVAVAPAAISYRSMTYCICAVAMVVSTAMCFILPAKPRNGWLPEVMAIVAVAPAAISLLPGGFDRHAAVKTLYALIFAATCLFMANVLRWQYFFYKQDATIHALIEQSTDGTVAAVKTLYALIFAATCLFMANVLRWQYFFYKQDATIHALIEQSTDGTVYYDVFPPEEMPKTVLFQPIQATWIHSFQIISVNNCDTTQRLIAVVPTALRNLRLSDAKPVSRDSGIYAFRNILLGIGHSSSMPQHDASSANGQRNVTGTLRIDTSSGESHTAFTDGFRFISAEGDTLFYLRPAISKIHGDIVSASWENL